MNLTGESKFFLSILLGTSFLVVIAAFAMTKPTPPPKPVDRSQLIIDGTWTKGPASASATLVEFSDFQCPACRAYQPIIDMLVEKYKDQLLFAYRHFPLDQHPLGFPAAQTAEAAGRQGKFWEMYSLLFQNQDKFSDTLWNDLAKELKLDLNQFATDSASQAVKEKIENDRTEGITLGVNSTPTFFLNGEKLPPSSSFAAFQQAIEAKLTR